MDTLNLLFSIIVVFQPSDINIDVRSYLRHQSQFRIIECSRIGGIPPDKPARLPSGGMCGIPDLCSCIWYLNDSVMECARVASFYGDPKKNGEFVDKVCFILLHN
jgi:hypothetical protein